MKKDESFVIVLERMDMSPQRYIQRKQERKNRRGVFGVTEKNLERFYLYRRNKKKK